MRIFEYEFRSDNLLLPLIMHWIGLQFVIYALERCILKTSVNIFISGNLFYFVSL